MSEHFALRLARSHMMAPTVRHMAYDRVDGQPFAFVPGQFVQIHFSTPDGKPLRRSYSVATYDGDPANPTRQIEMAVSYVEGGAATKLLSTLKEGEEIQASGPYGRFVLGEKDTNARYLLIATGTGVTPYRAMLPQLRKLIPERHLEVHLLFGARRPVELLYAAEFERFAAEVPGFHFHACLSREPREPVHAHDHAGRVTSLLPLLAPDAARDIAYLCGNPEMVDACFTQLKDYGLPIPNIRREKYISPADPVARSGRAAASPG